MGGVSILCRDLHVGDIMYSFSYSTLLPLPYITARTVVDVLSFRCRIPPPSVMLSLSRPGRRVTENVPMTAVRKYFLATALLVGMQFIGISSASRLPEFPLSDSELKVHAGYYTDGGKYLGGIPGYKNMYEMFDCTEYLYDFSYGNAGGIAKVCKTWIANEVSSTAYDVARCSCESFKDTEYCDMWTCSLVAVYTPISCSDSDVFCYIEREVGTTQCMCEIEAYSGKFCSSWVCLDTDSLENDDGGGGVVVTEEHTCVTTSPTADFCVEWTGVIDTSNALGVSTCACVQGSTANSVCSHWECQMRGMDRCSSAGSGWCDIDYAVGIGGLFGSLGAIFVAVALFRFLKNSPPICRSSGLDYFLGFAWMGVWSIGVVIWGGEDGATYVTLWWMSIIAIGLLCGCYVKSWGQDRSFVCL